MCGFLVVSTLSSIEERTSHLKRRHVLLFPLYNQPKGSRWLGGVVVPLGNGSAKSTTTTSVLAVARRHRFPSRRGKYAAYPTPTPMMRESPGNNPSDGHRHKVRGFMGVPKMQSQCSHWTSRTSKSREESGTGKDFASHSRCFVLFWVACCPTPRPSLQLGA